MFAELEPAKVFEYFELLSSVPRGSGNTKAVSDICVDFARERGLEYYQDDLNNVIIYKPASKGCEAADTVIIQGHLDMVCAKTPDSRLDMAHQPITLIVDGDYLRADDTTLGGDDGIAVAMALAVLDSDELRHPALECVFTVDEETGMDGAAAIDGSRIKGRKLLNIDSEEEGIFTCGCAGGCRISAELDVERISSESGKNITSDDILKYDYFEVKIDGLLGGHSGADIDKHRISGTHKLGSVLFMINNECPILLSAFYGGDFDNVICSKASAIIAVAPENADRFSELIGAYNDKMKEEYGQDDPDAELSCKKLASTAVTFTHAPLDRASSDRVFSSVYYLPQGIAKMSEDMPGLVETSSNLGIVRLERNLFKFTCSVRSSIASQKEMLVEEITDLVDTLDGRSETRGNYPGWEFKKESALRDVCISVYKEQYGEEPEVVAIHAGLECGLFMEKLPGLDAISFGPDIIDIHTPSEKLGIKSTERVWKMLVSILDRLSE